jgi:hypothetical protein
VALFASAIGLTASPGRQQQPEPAPAPGAIGNFEELYERLAADLNRSDAMITKRLARIDAMFVGTVAAYVGSAPPDGWLACDGSPIDAAGEPGSHLALLAQRLGTKFDPAGQRVLLPDLRGQFLRGAVPGTVSVGTVQGFQTALPQSTPFRTNQSGAFDPAEGQFQYLLSVDGTGTAKERPDNSPREPNLFFAGRVRNIPHHSHLVDGGGDPETRPANVAVQWIIYAGLHDTGLQGGNAPSQPE